MSTGFYEVFIRPYSPAIAKICRAYTDSREDFEDYCQEVYLQLWRSREQFKDQCKWSTWVYRITLNVCMTLLRNRKRRLRIGMGQWTDAVDENTAFANEQLHLLYAAIKQLSPVDRALILLYLEEKSHEEIAQVIGTNANNIAVRMSRIKERLKKLLDE